MKGRVLYAAWLLVVWVALWADVSVANVASGAVVAIVLLVAFPSRREPELAGPRPLATARLVGYFVWKLVEASAVVAWEVVTPRNRIREGVVAVRLRNDIDGVTTIVANAISLVPGTLTLDVETNPTVLYVHVLHLRDEEAVRREVAELEALVLRAFGPASALDPLNAELARQALIRPSDTSAAATGLGPHQEEPREPRR